MMKNTKKSRNIKIKEPISKLSNLKINQNTINNYNNNKTQTNNVKSIYIFKVEEHKN